MLRMFIRFRGWAPLIPLALGVAIIFVGTTISDTANHLAQEGVDGTATVIDKYELSSLSTTNNTRTVDYVIRYNFPLGDGTLHYDRREVSYGFYDEVEIGMQIPVQFLAADPDTNEIEAGALSDSAIAAMIIGGILALTGGVWFWFVARSSSRAVAAIERGNRAEAIVTKVVKADGANHVRFKFPDPHGQERQGRSHMGWKWRIDGVRDGDRIFVRYDPNAPQRVFWERDLGLDAGT